MLTFLGDPLDEILGKCWGHFVSTTLTVFYCITVYRKRKSYRCFARPTIV